MIETNEKLEKEFIEYLKLLDSKRRFRLVFDLEALAFTLFDKNDYKEEIVEIEKTEEQPQPTKDWKNVFGESK